MKDINSVVLDMVVDRQGNIIQKQADLSRVPASSKEALEGLADQIQDAMDAMAVPLPGKLVKPGESWKANRAVPIDTMEAFQSGAMEVTYTYRGTRTTATGPQGSRDRHGRGKLRGSRTPGSDRQRHHMTGQAILPRSHPQGDRGGPDQIHREPGHPA